MFLEIPNKARMMPLRTMWQINILTKYLPRTPFAFFIVYQKIAVSQTGISFRLRKNSLENGLNALP